jgi:rhodanese-related sulfurtransferase
LVICHSGQRSQRVATALVDAGKDAINVIGGMLAWQQAGGDVVAEGSEPPRV